MQLHIHHLTSPETNTAAFHNDTSGVVCRHSDNTNNSIIAFLEEMTLLQAAKYKHTNMHTGLDQMPFNILSNTENLNRGDLPI